LIALLAGAFYYPRLKQKWQAPLGPGLELPTHTPTQPPTSSPTQPTATTASLVEAGSPTETSIPTTRPDTPTPTPQPLCGGPEVMTLLAIGADSDADYLYGLSDVIRIVRVDFVTPKVTMLSMPRDLWVELPEGIGKPGSDPIAHSKLNQSYFYGSPGMGYYDGPGAGPGLLARTLDLNFGLRADHYGAVNMITFERIVDAVGGIDVYLPTDVDGSADSFRRENMGYFYAGNNHFTGDEALRFSRIRKGIGDFNRADNQTLVLCALQKKLLDPGVLPRIPKIIASFQDAVSTDLSLEQMSQLACLLPQIQRENLIFTSMPEEIFTSSKMFSPQMNNETFVLKADPAVIRDYISQFMAGTWPTQPDEPSCP